MTDRELKKMLKYAYTVPETNSGRKFIRTHAKRSMKIREIIILEMKYMGLYSVICGFILGVVLLVIMKMEDQSMMWAFSSLIPFGAIAPALLLSISERNGMDELEASSRFSLRFIRLVRMGIIGLFTAILFIVIGMILKSISEISGIDYLAYVIIPYLISDYGAMAVTRRIHGSESVPGVLAVCILDSVVPVLLRTLRKAVQMPNVVFVIVTIALFAGVITECMKYLKESESLTWSLY